MATLLQEQFEVVIIGRGEINKLDRSTKLSVETRGNDRTQVLVMETDHNATVFHQLVEIVFRRTSVLYNKQLHITSSRLSLLLY